jgi:uncharacterized membrane protein SpoIIM required for sporulation
VTLGRFLDQRAGGWDELEQLLRAARGRPERLGADGVRRLGALYRGATADLAEARRRFPGDPVVRQLETLVTRARPVVYSSTSRRASLKDFVSRGYWRLVLGRPGLLALAAAALFVPAVLAAFWGVSDPGAAIGVVPEEFRGAGEGGGRSIETGGEQAAFASEIFTNNIRVTFLAFAGGVLFGAGTILILAYNGLFLGAIVGIAIDAGNGETLTELVTPHGVLELSCIVVAGAAGLRMGSALIRPGRRRRAVALTPQARLAVALVLGTAPWLVLAGLVEGFVTPRHLDIGAAVAVGTVLGVVYWAIVLWRGRGSEPSAALGAEVGADAGDRQPVGGRLDHVGAGAA